MPPVWQQHRSLSSTAAVAALLLGDFGCARPGSGFEGQWQFSWQGRIGTEQAMLSLQPSGQLLNGSYRSARGSVPLSGSVHDHEVSFVVNFSGPPPYRVEFSGTLHGNRIAGQAQPQDVNGRAFAGHGGEVSPDYYSWTALRVGARD